MRRSPWECRRSYNRGRRICGHYGWVSLLSPEGEIRQMWIHGRRFDHRYVLHESMERRDKGFRRLLSTGWKVISQEEREKLEAEREERRKQTDLVIGTTKTGDQSHGGEHASQEVKDSPNQAKRGCRGGRGQKAKEERQRQKYHGQPIQLAKCEQRSGGAVYSPQPLQPKAEVLASAEASAKLLLQLVGRAESKLKRGIVIDSERLVTALEIGDDPLPALETPDERPRLRVLVTPDCSGSTQGWSGLATAWAQYLSRVPDLEVIYLENVNGDLARGLHQQARQLVERVDLVLYLGDMDGYNLCRQYAGWGATVVALDSYCANVAKPRCKTEQIHGGTLHWVDRVSAKIPDTWHQAIARCL